MLSRLSLRQRLLSLSLFSAWVLLGIITFAHFQLESIGRNVEAIAEQDMPLKDAITQVTIHQYDLALSIERALHYGVEMAITPESEEVFEAAVEEFLGYMEKVETSVGALKEVAASAVASGISSGTMTDLSQLQDTIVQIEEAQMVQIFKAMEAFDALRHGDFDTANAASNNIHETMASLKDKTQGLLAQIGQSSIASAKNAQSRQDLSMKALWGGGTAVLFVSILLSLMFAHVTAKPLMTLKTVMLRLAEGDHDVDVPFQRHRAEIGEMARAVDVLRKGALEAEQLRKDRLMEAEVRQEEIRQTMLELSNSLEETLETSVKQVAQKTDQMRDHARRLGDSAGDVNRQAVTVASASEEASNNVATVASAADQLANIASEINANVTQSAEVAQSAVEDARATNASVKGLTDAAGKIGDVVSLINEIAEQTNLLALNATIEAARAGEHGKGFAVVAHEVKNLATQTAQATQEIGEQVASIRAATAGAVDAIDAIGQTVLQLDERSRIIAASVEEQEAATREIALNAQQLSRGTQEVSASINQVSSSSSEANSLAQDVSTASDDISTSMTALQQNLKEVLRSSYAGDRRDKPRVTAEFSTQYKSGNTWRDCHVWNISAGGASLSGIENPSQGRTIVLRIPDVGEVKSTITQVTDGRCGVIFLIEDDQLEASLDAKYPAEDAAENAEDKKAAA